MYTDKFRYEPSYGILKDTIKEFKSLYKMIQFREDLLDMFENERDVVETNEFKQSTMDMADDKLMKRIEKTVEFLKNNELFCDMFTKCEHDL